MDILNFGRFLFIYKELSETALGVFRFSFFIITIPGDKVRSKKLYCIKEIFNIYTQLCNKQILKTKNREDRELLTKILKIKKRTVVEWIKERIHVN